jgi:transposase
MDIHVLFKQLGSIRAVAKQTGFSRNTVRKMLRSSSPPKFEKGRVASAIDPFKEHVTRRFTEHGLSANRLLEEIRAQGFTGSIHMVRRLLRKLRPLRVAAARATLRFETAPGHQAQCDWAYCGRHPDRDGKLVPVYAFVMVLSFSRTLFIRFTTSMRMAELLDCHRRAFLYFGGVPHQVLNPVMVDFASHHGFAIKTCRPYRPRTKGKVERMVDYVKDNFLRGRTFADMDDLNSQAQAWLDQTANVRVHATTGHRPVDLLASERPALTPWDLIRTYTFIERHSRRVARESMVSFEASRYSVPPVYVGREVTVELCGERGVVIIRSGDAIVAEHRAASRPGQSLTHKEHLDELWKLAIQRDPSPPPDWRLAFEQEVAARPLERYQRLVDEPVDDGPGKSRVAGGGGGESSAIPIAVREVA